MVEFEIFTIDRGGGRRPKTLTPQGRIPGGERFGQLPSGKFATRAAAERASRELRREFADRDTPVGVRPVPTAAEAAAKSRFMGDEIIGPAPSGRGRRLQRERLGREAIEKARKGIPISTAEREAARRLTRTDIQPVKETARLQKALRVPTIKEQKQIISLKREKRLTSKIRRVSLAQRIQAQQPPPLPQPQTISMGGVPLTLLGDPRQLEVIRKEPTAFETAQRRGLFESLRLIGGEGLNALTIAAEDIRSGFIGGIADFGEGLFDRPIGKVQTGLFETERGVSVLGKTLIETTKQITPDQELLFPVISETAAKAARAAESALEFVFEDIPKGAKASFSFVVSEEGREIFKDIGIATVKQLKERPGETLLAAGTIAALGTFGFVKSTTGAFKQDPIFIATELAAFGEVGKIGFAAFREIRKIGARLRITKTVKEPISEVVFTEFEKRITDPTFTFEPKPFVIVAEKPPAFLQRTLKGEVITPKQQDILLKEIRARLELPEPKTLKELRFELGRREGRQRATREQAEKLDIFKPVIEEKLFIEPGRAGLVTPGALGRKEIQTTFIEGRGLRGEILPTTAQKAAFLLSQLPRVTIPTRGKSLFERFPTEKKGVITFRSIFPRGKKGQAGLLQQDFNIGELLRGAGEGLIRRIPRAREFPRIAEIRPIEIRTRFPFSFSTGVFAGVFAGVETDRIAAQRAEQVTGGLFPPIEIQQPRLRQRQPSLLDLNILQDQPTDIKPIQEVFQEQRARQKQRQKTALISEQVLEPLLDIPISKFFPETRPIIERPLKTPKLLGVFNNIEEIGAAPQGFDIIIREKGQDVKVNKKQSFPRTRAKNIGANIVDNSSAASFRIKKSIQPMGFGIDDPFFNLERKFRSPKTKSKLPPKQFIEKRRFRIDTPGELKGITAKGLIAKRKKAIRGDFLSGFGGGIEL